MSAIAGIYNLDKRPVDRHLLGRMLDCVPQWGSDAVRIWTDGFVGLGHRQLCTTEESLREVQPAHNRRRTAWITFDGRVDNREELVQSLRPRAANLISPTDVDLLLAAYEFWGTDCLEHVIGDFSFALWDAREQRLFCARDTYGIRPFYYHFDGTAFTFGTDILQIFQNPNISKEIDAAKIAEWFTPCGLFHHNFRDIDRTFFLAIKELPHAHYLLIDKSGVKTSRYWDVDPQHEIKHRRQADYVEHFSQLFQESVHSRLRSLGPIGAELSGGFDSSSIVCIASEQLKDARAPTTPLTTYSLVFDSLSCDERTLLSRVISKYQLESHFIAADSLCELDDSVETPLSGVAISTPEQAHMERALNALYQTAHENGVRVMLSGEGAESQVLGNPFVFDSLSRRFEFGELAKRVRVLSANNSARSCIGYVLRFAFAPLLPKQISRSFYRKWVHPEFDSYQCLNVFCPPFHDRIHEEIRKQDERFQRLPTFVEWGRQLGYETQNPSAPIFSKQFLYPLERRFPYLDRRLIEFSLAVPPETKYEHLIDTERRTTRGRALQRQAFKGILPDEIRLNRSKTNFNDVSRRRMLKSRRTLESIFSPPGLSLVGKFELIDTAKFWELLRHFLSDLESGRSFNANAFLWINRIVQLEHWLVRLSSGHSNPLSSNFALEWRNIGDGLSSKDHHGARSISFSVGPLSGDV
jgi:asparagine synthase (glutamine-hydrolysing)